MRSFGLPNDLFLHGMAFSSRFFCCSDSLCLPFLGLIVEACRMLFYRSPLPRRGRATSVRLLSSASLQQLILALCMQRVQPLQVSWASNLHRMVFEGSFYYVTSLSFQPPLLSQRWARLALGRAEPLCSCTQPRIVFTDRLFARLCSESAATRRRQHGPASWALTI